MKTFCAILLVGFAAYVNASKHDCDPFAVNTEKKESGSADVHDQVIELKKFIENPALVYYVTGATPSKVPGSSRFCTAPTHGEECQAVGYYREITKTPKEGSPEGVKGLEFKTVFVGVSGKDKTAIKYEMTIKGTNEDDYIFKHVEGTEITAHEIVKDGPLKKIDNIPADILNALKQEFAMFYVGETGFTIYTTCNGETFWVSHLKSKVNTKSSDPIPPTAEFTREMNRLKEVALKETKTSPDFSNVTTLIDDAYKHLIPQAA